MKKTVTWILVADGARAAIYQSEGWGGGLHPVTTVENPAGATATGDLGTERPGRVHDRTGSRRHALETPVDWQSHAKHVFAQKMAAHLEQESKSGKFDRLVLVAPPKVLGDLRAALGKGIRSRVTAELDKDLTHSSMPQLVAQLEKITPV